MSEEQQIYDRNGKFMGTFRPAKGSQGSSGGGCLAVILGFFLLVYLVLEGWSGVVSPTYHFAPAEGEPSALLVNHMTFEKGRFWDSGQVKGHFLVSVSDDDTLYFTGTWDDELRLTMAEHDFKYNTFKSGEEVVVQWDSDGVTLENKNALSDEYGQVERWEGGMDSVQWWMALILVVTALWIVRKLFRG